MTPEERAAIDERRTAFNKSLLGEDELGMVIRGHVHIEHELEGFIRARLTKPKELDQLKLDFSGRVKLAIALGLDERFRPALNFVGGLRNRFAHQLDIAIRSEDARDFYKALDEEAKEIAATQYKATHAKFKIPGRPGDMGQPDPRDRCTLFFVVLWSAVAVAGAQARALQ